jgi:hypothetical protein
MQDRTNPANWPTHRGPWHEVPDLSRLHDTGEPWCLNAAGHPDSDREYPDPNVHFPFDECRTRGYYIEDVRAGLTGPLLDLELYGAKPFQFGQPREATPAGRARVVLDVLSLESAGEPSRLSLPLGEALLFASQLRQLVAALDGR